MMMNPFLGCSCAVMAVTDSIFVGVVTKLMGKGMALNRGFSSAHTLEASVRAPTRNTRCVNSINSLQRIVAFETAHFHLQ